MGKDISLTVTCTERRVTSEDKDVTYHMVGRLLGACNPSEATKIAQNWPVAERVHTSESKNFDDVVKELVAMGNDSSFAYNKGFGHVIFALRTLRADYNKTDKEAASRKLYISPPLTFISEHKDNKITIECANGAMLVMEDKK